MKTLIIAEAGVNHNGSIELAKKLIDAASDAGADYVKFQTFKAIKLVSKTAQKADYQSKNLNNTEETQFSMLKKLELSEEAHFELVKYCNEKNIKFLSTGFDEESIDFLEKLGIDLYKIPSGEITNKPFLQHIAKKKKSIILSTGMSDIIEIEDAVKVLINEGISINDISILHCNTEYPTPMKDVNLKAMNLIGEKFCVNIGYSDHTLGIEVPIAAVALGAKIIEKHFTLDRNMEGPDHKASLEPSELKQMVLSIRNIELALSGSGAKLPSESELKNKAIARKSIHLNRNIKEGEIINFSDLIMKRPGDGISPMDYEKIIGRIAKRNLEIESKLSWNDIL